jgi:hypothetical protein
VYFGCTDSWWGWNDRAMLTTARSGWPTYSRPGIGQPSAASHSSSSPKNASTSGWSNRGAISSSQPSYVTKVGENWIAGTPQRPANRRAVHAPMSYTTRSGRSSAYAAASTGSTDRASSRNRRMAGAISTGHSRSSVGRLVGWVTGTAPASATMGAKPGSTA